MQGTSCPVCHNEVMPYGRFFREAEPNKTSACSHCGVALRRSPAVWALLTVAGVLLAVVIGSAVYLLLQARALDSFWLAGAALGVVVIWTFVVNFIGWRFVGWRVVAKP